MPATKITARCCITIPSCVWLRQIYQCLISLLQTTIAFWRRTTLTWEVVETSCCPDHLLILTRLSEEEKTGTSSSSIATTWVALIHRRIVSSRLSTPEPNSSTTSFRRPSTGMDSYTSIPKATYCTLLAGATECFRPTPCPPEPCRGTPTAQPLRSQPMARWTALFGKSTTQTITGPILLPVGLQYCTPPMPRTWQRSFTTVRRPPRVTPRVRL